MKLLLFQNLESILQYFKSFKIGALIIMLQNVDQRKFFYHEKGININNFFFDEIWDVVCIGMLLYIFTLNYCKKNTLLLS